MNEWGLTKYWVVVQVEAALLQKLQDLERPASVPMLHHYHLHARGLLSTVKILMMINVNNLTHPFKHVNKEVGIVRGMMNLVSFLFQKCLCSMYVHCT